MPKLERLKEELHFDKQLIVTAIVTIVVTIWLAIRNISIGWPLISGAVLVLLASVVFIIKKRQKIKELLQKIEDC